MTLRAAPLAFVFVLLFAPLFALHSSFVTSVLAARHALGTEDILVVNCAGLGSFVDDPRDAGLARALDLLDERFTELFDEFGSTTPLPLRGLLLELAANPFCLRVRPSGAPGGFPLELQLAVQFPDIAGARELLGTISGTRGQDSLAEWTPMGPVTLNCEPVLGAADGRALFRLALGEVRPEDFEFAGSGLPDPATPLFLVRFDGRRAAQSLRPLLAAGGPEAAQVWEVLEGLGLIGEAAPVRSLALGRSTERTLLVCREIGGAAGDAGTATTEPVAVLDAADFARLPADSTLAWLGACRPADLFQQLERVARSSGFPLRHWITRATGVDPVGDLADHLGPVGGVYFSEGAGGGGLSSAVAFVTTSGAEQVRGALENLAQFASDAAREPMQGRVAFRDWSHAEYSCTSLTFPGLPIPLEPCWAVTGDVLYLAAGRAALQSALDQRGAQSSIRDHRRLTALPQKALQGLTGFAFLDAHHAIGRGYGAATLTAAGLANLVRSPSDPSRDAGTVLPALSELREGLQPFLAWTRRRAGGQQTVLLLDHSWTATATALAGTPMAQGYTGVMALGIVSSIAIPNLLTARVSANESAAVATLRNLAAAQEQFRATAVVDTDEDGLGEYGTLGEMAGARPVRLPAPTGSVWGRPGVDQLNPPVLGPSFAELFEDGKGGSVVARSGYLYQVHLPGAARGALTPGFAEPFGGRPGSPTPVDSDGAENHWCAYAWPMQAGRTGGRVFCIDEQGEVWTRVTHESMYTGTWASGGRQPAFDAARSRPDMATVLGGTARDGSEWVSAR